VAHLDGNGTQLSKDAELGARDEAFAFEVVAGIG